MVEILCTAFSYKELYKNYQKVVDNSSIRGKSLTLRHRKLEKRLTNKKEYDKLFHRPSIALYYSNTFIRNIKIITNKSYHE